MQSLQTEPAFTRDEWYRREAARMDLSVAQLRARTWYARCVLCADEPPCSGWIPIRIDAWIERHLAEHDAFYDTDELQLYRAAHKTQ